MGADQRSQPQTPGRLRRWAPGLIALSLLSLGAFGTQAVANAAVPTADEVATSECSNLSVAWTDGISHDVTGQAVVSKVTISGAGAGCVGRTLGVQLQDGGTVLGSGSAPVTKAGVPVVVSLAHPVDVAALDSVTVVAG